MYVSPPPTTATAEAHHSGANVLRNDIQIPFYAVIVFGCYLLGRLGLAIFTFNDVPEAHEELQREIEQAKVELRRGKVDVD